ncbi:MAG TPA: hypothetical protein VN426_04840 [Syntrophomonadaceae bacterium]|nr:hypothetical protein [Syntrophomonadaceae bacterium]
MAAYMAGHLDAVYVTAASFYVPWDLDVSLIALMYLAFGYYRRKYISNSWLLPLAALSSLLFLVAFHLGLFDYHLDTKYLVYANPILDLAIPVSLS